MLRQHRRFFLWTALAGLALRLFFLNYLPAFTDDSRVYFDLARNWLLHGVYGQTQSGVIVPTDARLPGYPAYLAAIFWIFGVGNVRAVLIVQVLFDLGTSLLVADLTRRVVGGRNASRIAFLLAATCPFLMTYAVAALTETLEIFFTALAMDCAVAALERMRDPSRGKTAWFVWAAAGASAGACILLRPDGGLVLAAIVLFLGAALWKRGQGSRSAGASHNAALHWRSTLAAGMIVIAFAIAPLVPWAIRNLRTLHHFQPLAPRYATESEELAPRGFNRWVQTWLAEYVSVEEVYWNVPGDKIDVEKLPTRALDEPTRDATLGLIAEYNESNDLTPELDAQFRNIAAERFRAHRVRSYFLLPLARVADMWLRPRTDFLPSDVRWWEFNDDPSGSVLAVGFGLLNLFYVAAAVAALLWRRADLRYLTLLVGFVVLRTAMLWTVENPETRYTLECYPVVLVLAAASLQRRPLRDS